MSDRELEIVARLKDEITYKLNDIHKSFKKLDSQTRTSNKQMGGFNKNIRESLKPIRELRQTFLQVASVTGIATGAFVAMRKIVKDVSSEIHYLDQTAIRLGTTTEALSRGKYGFNIATPEVRIGAAAMDENAARFNSLIKFFEAQFSNFVGKQAVKNEANRIFTELMAKRGELEYKGKKGPITLDEIKALSARAKEVAKYQLSLKNDVPKGNSREADSANIALLNKTKQLTLSFFEFKRQQMLEEVALYRKVGADEQRLKEYQSAYEKSLDDERLIQIKKMQADRLEAQGQMYAAMELRDQAALEEFKKKFGASGEMVQEYKKSQEVIRQQKSILNQTLKNIAGDMSDSLANNMTSLKGFVSEVTESIGNHLKKLAADFAISFTLGRAHPAFNLLGLPLGWKMYHQGGLIKAHSGLAIDEVPIIAQTGEGILSRRGMSTLGRSNFEQLNRGKSIGGGETVVNYYIYANDAKSFVSMLYQNKEAIHGLVTENVARNGAIRGSMKKYA